MQTCKYKNQTNKEKKKRKGNNKVYRDSITLIFKFLKYFDLHLPLLLFGHPLKFKSS